MIIPMKGRDFMNNKGSTLILLVVTRGEGHIGFRV